MLYPKDSYFFILIVLAYIWVFWFVGTYWTSIAWSFPFPEADRFSVPCFTGLYAKSRSQTWGCSCATGYLLFGFMQVNVCEQGLCIEKNISTLCIRIRTNRDGKFWMQGGEGDCFYVVGHGEFEVLATQVTFSLCIMSICLLFQEPCHFWTMREGPYIWWWWWWWDKDHFNLL